MKNSLPVVIAATMALGGCFGPAPGETRVETVSVAVRAPCPDDGVYQRVIDEQPVPLRDQPRPEGEDAVEAALRGQLGLYEGTPQQPGFIDLVMAVIENCHSRQPLPEVEVAE